MLILVWLIKFINGSFNSQFFSKFSNLYVKEVSSSEHNNIRLIGLIFIISILTKIQVKICQKLSAKTSLNFYCDSNWKQILKAKLFILLYPVDVIGLFLYPLKASEKNSGFLVFSGGKERDQWYEMGLWNSILQSNLLEDYGTILYPSEKILVQSQ